MTNNVNRVMSAK